MAAEKVKIKNISVVTFFNEQIEFCRLNRSLGTARNYSRTLSSFLSFMGGRDIPFSRMTGELILRYERWLLSRGVTRNSSSFYIRNLRSIFNKAARRGLTERASPFFNVYTGVDNTRKRAVDEGVILRLLKMDLSHSRALELSRDLFVFRYCTRGMSFVDIAFLRKSDVCGGFITYVRRKPGQQLRIRIEPCIGSIINRYSAAVAGSPYVFPVITTSDPEAAYSQYQVALGYHNRKLKRIGSELGIPLSSYTARHTWATTARNHNVPISVISEGMGHASEKITRIYLASLDNSVIDEANRGILGELNCAVSMQETTSHIESAELQRFM